MARSLSNAKLFSALVVHGISRRGYASTPQVVVERGVKRAAEEGSEKLSSWLPDPVTGYYRPGIVAGEVDVAELRALLLKSRTNN